MSLSLSLGLFLKALGNGGVMGNFLTGTGAPGAGVGNDGDVYLATDTLAFYGPKATGAWPAALFTQVTTSAAQTLTSKTLTAPVISTISNTGTLTLPTSTDTLVGKATTDTLTNKTLTTPVIASISNGGTITVPTGTDTLVGKATTDTLTNKTLTSPVISSISNGGAVTIPSGVETLVGRATTDTLTNKSISGATNTVSALAASVITTGQLAAARGGLAADASAFTGLANFTTGVAAALAPGTSGNVATSNGSAWTSAAPTGAHPGVITQTAAITPTALSAGSYNDYAPTSLSTCSVILQSVSGSASSVTLTGLTAQPAGTRILVCNTSTIASGNSLNLTGESASSSAANRFSNNITLNPGYSVELWYDTAASRWRVLKAA